MRLKRPEITAEFTINHLGMRNIVQATLDRCKQMGVDFVKFKIKDVHNYYKRDGKRFRGFDFIDYRHSLELSHEDFRFIDQWCRENDMKWFSTAHDFSGLEFLSKFDLPYFKIASMDALNRPLLDKMLELNTRRVPVIVSVGGLDYEQTEAIVRNVTDAGCRLMLLHTVSIYPTPLDKCSIQTIPKLRELFGAANVRIGYSGHEIGYVPTLLAVQAGAEMIERHITLSKDLRLHHIDAALTTDEFENMITDIDAVITSLNVGEKAYFDEEHSFLRERHYT